MMDKLDGAWLSVHGWCMVVLGKLSHAWHGEMGGGLLVNF